MRSRSARYDAAIVASHTAVTRVDVLFAREVVLENVQVISGTVTLDRRAQIRGRLDVTLAEPDRLPIDLAGYVFTPFGFELAVSRGVRYQDGTEELFSLGVFPIQRTTMNGADLTVTIAASDRSKQVQDARIEDDATLIAGDADYATVIESVITTAVPDLSVSLAATGYDNTAATIAAGDDPWALASDMAKSVGRELYFDGTGALVLAVEPTTYQNPVLTIADSDAGQLVDFQVDLDREQSYNRVIATGSNADLGFVPRGVATDDDPNSPSYYYGSFGRKPRFYSSPFIATDTQAAQAAGGILASSLGVPRGFNLDLIPNPALELGDVIRVVRSSLTLDELHLVDAMTIGLGPDQVQRIITRSRNVG